METATAPSPASEPDLLLEVRDDGDSDFLLPIVLGVSGHRDLRPQDVPALERAVEEVLATIAREQPSSPIVLLSPLAEGADQLVARVFLRLLGDDPRHQLVAPLPLPLEEYSRDFEEEAVAAEFRSLLARARMIELPLLAGASRASVRESAPHRDAQYRQLGAFIARRSQILIALWNGEEEGKPAGTSEVVRFRMQGIPHTFLPHAEPLDPPEHGPVYHVNTPRASRPGAREAGPRAGETRLLFPESWATRAVPGAPPLELLLQQIEGFNREALGFLRRFPERVRSSLEYLADGTDPAATGLLGPGEERIMKVYAVADALAIHHQRLAHRVVRLLLRFAVVAILANQVYTNLVAEQWVGGVYLVLLVTGGAILLLANRLDWQQKHFNYRALAEGLRVQFFWRVARVNASVADGYLRAQREDLMGIRLAMRFFELAFPREESPTSASDAERLGFVFRNWVVAQRRYFLGGAEGGGVVRRDGARRGRVLLLVQLCFTGAIALVLAMVLFHDAVADVMGWLESGSAVLLGISAAALAYDKIMGFSEHVRTSEKMGELFSRAEQELGWLREDLGAAEREHGRERVRQGRAVLHDLGREALAENADWVILHRSRPWEFSLG